MRIKEENLMNNLKKRIELLKAWIIIVGLFLLVLSFSCCSSIKMSNIPSYPFYDRDGKMHKYKTKVITPYEPHLNQYCQQHFEWEKITILYTRKGRKYLVKGA